MIPEKNEPLVKAKKIGVRERSKQERQDRIMMAARKLFAEQGYDATTLRQVAEQSGLGLGTLFKVQASIAYANCFRLEAAAMLTPCVPERCSIRLESGRLDTHRDIALLSATYTMQEE